MAQCVTQDYAITVDKGTQVRINAITKPLLTLWFSVSHNSMVLASIAQQPVGILVRACGNEGEMEWWLVDHVIEMN